MKAAAVALVANTAPVAFGAIAIPIVTLAGLTEIPKEDLGAMVGRQTPILALFVPLILVGMVDGLRGVRAVWPAAMVGGVTFAHRPVRVLELHLGRADRHRRRRCCRWARWSRFLRVWQPGRAAARRGRRWRPARRSRAPPSPTRPTRRPCVAGRGPARTRPARSSSAYAPYLIIIVVFSLAQLGPIKDFLAGGAVKFTWPGLDILNAKGEAPTAVTYNFNWLAAAGTLLLVCGLITMVVPAGRRPPAPCGPTAGCSASSSGRR